MKLSLFLASLLLLQSAPSLAKKKKEKPLRLKIEVKVTSVEFFREIPPLASGDVINPDFLKDFEKNAIKVKDCEDGLYGTDPLWKARMYFENLEDLSLEMPTLLAMKSSDYQVSHLAKEIVRIDDQIKEMQETSTFDTATKILNVISVVGGPYAAAAKTAKEALEIITFAMKTLHKYAENPKNMPKYALKGDVETQLKGIEDEREELIESFWQIRDSSNKIVKMLDGSRNNAVLMNRPTQELLRSTICRFAPVVDDYVHYTDFCRAENGGEDYNRLRGTFSCKDVQAISAQNREKTRKLYLSIFAQTIAANVTVGDRSGIYPEGIKSGFLLNVNYKPPVFDGPGGNKLLCDILQGPQYDEFWIEGSSPRKLKKDFTISQVGYPVMFKEEHGGFGPGTYWFYAVPTGKYSEPWKFVSYKIGRDAPPYRIEHPKEGINFTYLGNYGRKVWDPPVSEVVGELCQKKTKSKL